MSNEKRDNVVGIGHNQKNEFSKEQYEKLLNFTHWITCYAQSTISDIEHYFDEAFTKYEGGQSWQRKLKDFEVHEKRLEAKKLAKKYWSKGADKERIIKEAKDKGILEKFNNFKLKNDPSKPLKQRKADGHTPAGKKPSLDVYDKTGAGVGRKKGGPVKKYARGGGVRKAARY